MYRMRDLPGGLPSPGARFKRKKGPDCQPGCLPGMRGLRPELSFRSVSGRSRSGLRGRRDQCRPGAYRRLLLLRHRAEETRTISRIGGPKTLLLLNLHLLSRAASITVLSRPSLQTCRPDSPGSITIGMQPWGFISPPSWPRGFSPTSTIGCPAGNGNPGRHRTDSIIV